MRAKPPTKRCQGMSFKWLARKWLSEEHSRETVSGVFEVRALVVPCLLLLI